MCPARGKKKQRIMVNWEQHRGLLFAFHYNFMQLKNMWGYFYFISDFLKFFRDI